jgi:hypothetical protein
LDNRFIEVVIILRTDGKLQACLEGFDDIGLILIQPSSER